MSVYLVLNLIIALLAMATQQGQAAPLGGQDVRELNDETSPYNRLERAECYQELQKLQTNTVYGNAELGVQIAILQQITDDDLDHCWKGVLEQDDDETTEDRLGLDWWFVWNTKNGTQFIENYFWNFRTQNVPA
jgi:hypothetical protein